MGAKEDFEFLNSDIWLKYTQERYTPISDIKYRLEKSGYTKKDWVDLSSKIQGLRKTGSIPIFISSLDKKFWFFPSDSIQRKISEIEHIGNKIFERIQSKSLFENEFINNAALEEAITSAIYEGANSSRAKAKQLITSQSRPKNKDEWMLLNNYRAMKWIKENTNRDTTNDLILELHEIVTKNTLEGDDANFSGKLRNDKVYVGKSHEGIFHKKIKQAMNEAIDACVNNKRYLHGLLKGILLHYFIGYIHPFFDGNGRTARAVFYFKCMKNDLKFIELLSISAHLKEHGSKYEKSFDLVIENDLDLTYFVDFCLDSLLFAIKKANTKVEYLFKISTLREEYSLNENQIILLQKMALNKWVSVTAQDHAVSIGKSREIARRELKDLYEKDLLIEEQEGRKLVYYINAKHLKSLTQK